MRNKLTGANEGPSHKWAEWRERRDRAFERPKVNIGARKMAARAKAKSAGE